MLGDIDQQVEKEWNIHAVHTPECKAFLLEETGNIRHELLVYQHAIYDYQTDTADSFHTSDNFLDNVYFVSSTASGPTIDHS